MTCPLHLRGFRPYGFGVHLDVDFGRAADDYARHRPGFPPEVFEHVARVGIGVPRQRILDVGTGTGTLARGFAERGCDVIGLDPSPEMLAEAAKLDAQSSVRWVQGWAEATGLDDGARDVVCAGQCWHWFDRPRAAREALRVLRPSGRLLIVYFSYLPHAGSVGARTEELVLRHNPTWTWAGHDGRHLEYLEELRAAGLRNLDVFEFDLPIAFTHDSWRGRIRACNGVLTLPRETIASFDRDLAEVLAKDFPASLVIEHRVWGVVAQSEE